MSQFLFGILREYAFLFFHNTRDTAAKFIGELLKNSLASKHTAPLIQKAFLDIFPALEYGDGSAKH
jgi:hypothetical protein